MPLTAILKNRMLTLNLKYLSLALVTFFVPTTDLFAQIPDFSKVPTLHTGDSTNITYLINNGVKMTKGKVIAWFPKDSLSPKQMNEIIRMLNKGISKAEKFIGVPFSWQIHDTNQPYIFYFRHDRFVSHASGAGFVSIPFWRIKNGKAPWLHEVMHEMLDTKTGSWGSPAVTEKESDENMPLWLFEGLPDYVSLNVSLLEKLPFFDVFSNDFKTDMDSSFTKEIKSKNGPYILSFIGSKGIMPELFSEERNLYAPAFYHGSCSFVKFLVSNYEIKVLITAISMFKEELYTIEKLTGKPLKALKKEWLDQLGITE